MQNSYAIGIDVGGTNTDIGLVRDDSKIVSRSSIPTGNYSLLEPYVADIMEQISAMVAQGDPEKGVKYAQNDMGLYLKLLEEYVKSSEDKKKRLQECFTGRNMKDYTTYAHSLKSTSRTIGDDSLADLAARLEKAANGNDPDVISAEHDRMMERYDHTVDVVYEALRRGSRISTEKEDDTRGFSYHRWS